jgi:hypothetical protein
VADIAQVIGSGNSGLRLRTGTVVEVDTHTVSVELGQPPAIAVPTLDHVVDLVRGDVVQILADGSRMVIIGRLPQGQDGDTLFNGDFSRGLRGWNVYNYGGTCSALVTDITTEVRAVRVQCVSLSTAPNTHLVSQPMPVEVGQVWSVSAWVNGGGASGEVAMDAYIGMSWFAGAEELYPSYISGDTIAASATSVNIGTDWTELQGTVTVPSSAAYARMYLRSRRGTVGTGALIWANADAYNMSGDN